MELQIIQLFDLLEEFGEDPVRKILSEFSCPKNKDVSEFLHHKAILFENMQKSRTFLVLGIDTKKLCLIAYFSLTSRPIIFEESLSNKRKKQILGTGYEANNEISGILIGQFGKNFTDGYNLLITGKDLFDLALHKVLLANKLIGGRIVYLECEDIEKLRKFYDSVGFELYKDDAGTPIYSKYSLLTYIKPTKSIIMNKKIIRERVNKIKVKS